VVKAAAKRADIWLLTNCVTHVLGYAISQAENLSKFWRRVGVSEAMPVGEYCTLPRHLILKDFDEGLVSGQRYQAVQLPGTRLELSRVATDAFACC
jgi:hypothetical protein